MAASRVMPTQESADLIQLVRDLCAKELQPLAAEAEKSETFPRDSFRVLGDAGLLGLPYPEEYGGGGQPYEVYLQVIEEIASVWASVAVGVSVHALSCFGLATRGTEQQRQQWLPDMLGGELLGAYCLSEPHAGSDPAAMRTKAVREGDTYVRTGDSRAMSVACAAEAPRRLGPTPTLQSRAPRRVPRLVRSTVPDKPYCPGISGRDGGLHTDLSGAAKRSVHAEDICAD